MPQNGTARQKQKKRRRKKLARWQEKRLAADSAQVASSAKPTKPAKASR